MSKIIVTGANSFVGKALMKELIDQNNDVYAIVGESSDLGDLENLVFPGNIYRCDLSRYSQLSQILPKITYDACVHLAWKGTAGSARADWNSQFLSASSACDLVAALADMGVPRFVGVGTLAELDVLSYSPEDGSHPNAVSIYGVSKIAAQLATKAVCSSLNMEHIWCRLVNVYGPGNYTGNFTDMAARRFLDGERASFTECLQPYDFIFIEDVAKALACLIEKGHDGYTYLIGSGSPRPLREYVMMIRDAIDPNADIYFGEVPFNGEALDFESYDISSLCEHTGFKPQVPFEEGISKMVAWLKESR